MNGYKGSQVINMVSNGTADFVPDLYGVTHQRSKVTLEHIYLSEIRLSKRKWPLYIDRRRRQWFYAQ